MNNNLLIIPFYNEQNRISVSEYNSIFALHEDVDFLLVDDASSDATLKILNNFQDNFQNVSSIVIEKNSGKAQAIRHAVLNCKDNYKYIGYCDADLATPISEMIKLFLFVSDNKSKFAMGSRIKLIGNKVERSLKRHYLGRIFATIISQFVLKTPVYDTQCGAKVIEYNLAKHLFKEQFITKWLFDVELLLRMKKEYKLQENVIEIPLYEWKEKGNSKIKFADFFKFPFQIIKIYFYYGK